MLSANLEIYRNIVTKDGKSVFSNTLHCEKLTATNNA